MTRPGVFYELATNPHSPTSSPTTCVLISAGPCRPQTGPAMTDEELERLHGIAKTLDYLGKGEYPLPNKNLLWLVQRAKDANRLEREARYREAMQDKVAAAMQRDRERLLRDE